MRRVRVGRLLMTFVLVIQAALGFALDWSGNHLLNPLWHPHARFHGALLLFLLTGVSATGVWLMWRESREAEGGITASALIFLSFWTPFFFISALLPSAPPWAGGPGAIPPIAGHVFYSNEIGRG